MIKIKVDVKVMPIEAGTYILIYDPSQTSQDLIIRAITDNGENSPEAVFFLIPSHDPDSIRLLKTKIPVTIKE